MEESWATRNKKQREFFHHVAHLDKIYADDQQRKRIEQTINYFKRMSHHRTSSLANERETVCKSIREENQSMSKLFKQKGDHYLEHCLRPQLGLSEPTLLCSLSKSPPTTNPYEYAREKQNKLISGDNIKIEERLRFITSTFQQATSKNNFKNYMQVRKPDKGYRHRKDINMKGRTGSVILDQDGLTDQYKERLYKGIKFRDAPDKHSLFVGRQLDKESITSVLAILKKRKDDYESKFMLPKRLSHRPKHNQSQLSTLGNLDLVATENTSAFLNKSLPNLEKVKSKTDRSKILKHSIYEIGQLKRDIEEKRADRIEKKEKFARAEFRRAASTLFSEEESQKKNVALHINVKGKLQISNFFAAVNGNSSFQNIGSQGKLLIPWKEAFEKQIFELEFMNHHGQSETILFDISKENQKLALEKLVDYKLSVVVDIE